MPLTEMKTQFFKVIRVLIVDDSAVVRRALTEIITSDPQMAVMATAGDPFAAAEKMRQEKPDVIVLDVEMPKMDGVTFLKKLMAQHPIPVVICSSLVADKSDTYMAAMQAGAVDVICKPEMGTAAFLEHSRAEICRTIKEAASARVGKRSSRLVEQKLDADVMLPPPPRAGNLSRTAQSILAIGASTGGTEALRTFLEDMPENAPGIVIVQHMPAAFTAAFAKRLNSTCTITVAEARHGDKILAGRALIAPGNQHLLVKRSGAGYAVDVLDGPPVSRHRPSVDVLFRSVARSAGPNAVGIILTGMGDDGAKGLKEMRDAGARTLGESEDSCVVYGMPKEAKLLGGVEEELPLHRIALAALRLGQRSH